MKEKYKFDAVSFGIRLAKIRKLYELTQEQVAEQLDVSVKSVQNWEAGSKLPGIDNLVALSQLYNMAVGEILEDEPYRIFEKKASSRKRSIEIIEVDGKIEFFMEFTEDRYFDRYETYVWDEILNHKYLCATTSKIVSYDVFKKSMLAEADSIADEYREMFSGLLTDSPEDNYRREMLAKKIKCEKVGMAMPGAVFINGTVHCFDPE